MSRFLKTRHYNLVLPGVYLTLQKYPGFSILQAIHNYMDQTGVSYTEQDAAEIQTLYLRKYS